MPIENGLGISGFAAALILIALYFIIKNAVKNGIKEAYNDIEYSKKLIKEDKDNDSNDD